MAHTRYPVVVSGANAMISMPRWQSKDATGLHKVIVCFGHGGDSKQMMQSSGSGGGLMGSHATFLADHGCIVAAVDYSGTAWLNQPGIDLIVALDNALTATFGASGKASVLAHSMGGGMALRFAQENPTRVDCLYLNSPMTDMDSFHADPTYTAEIDTAYSGSYATTGSPRSPLNNPAAFRNAVPIRIVHPTDDATVAYAQSQAFIAAVNDPKVALRAPDITGGHNGGLTNITPRESWEWIRTHWAA